MVAGYGVPRPSWRPGVPLLEFGRPDHEVCRGSWKLLSLAYCMGFARGKAAYFVRCAACSTARITRRVLPPAAPGTPIILNPGELNAPRIGPGRVTPSVERGSFETLDLVVVRKRPTQPFKEPSHDTVTATLHRRHAVAQLRAYYPTQLCPLCRRLRPLFWAQPLPT